MKWEYDTGGRENYFKKLNVGDCVVRAIAIANDLDYKVSYNLVKRYYHGNTPRNGVPTKVYGELLKDLGWKYVSFSGRGYKGKGKFLNEKSLPIDETIICRVSNHLTTVIDGVIHDTYDCSKSGTRQVYGYWYRVLGNKEEKSL